MPLPKNNLSYPAKITFKTGECGSGFLLNHEDQKLYLITAKHVIYKKYSNNELVLFGNSITILVKDSNPLKVEPVKLVVDLSIVKIKVSAMADVCVIQLGELVKDPNKISGGGVIKFCNGVVDDKLNCDFVTVDSKLLISFNDVDPSNNVFVLGYPVSIGNKENPQIDYDQPLLRKGIVAGKNYKNKTIILDCPVYQGNSGGMAIQEGPKFGIIGVVTEFIPFFEIMFSLHHHYQNLNLENSGYSVLVPTDHILDLIKNI